MLSHAPGKTEALTTSAMLLHMNRRQHAGGPGRGLGQRQGDGPVGDAVLRAARYIMITIIIKFITIACYTI